MKALIVAAVLLASCSPSSSAPSPTATPTGAIVPPAATTPSPTATVAAGLTRYTSTELGYSVDLPAGWRRAVCSGGVVTTSPLAASEIFLNVPETEEYVTGGVRMVIVQVIADQGVTPLAWLQGSVPQPDTRIEPATVGDRVGARGFLVTTGDTYTVALAARGWIYAIERTYFGAEDREAERIVTSLRLLDHATVGQVATTTPTPRTIESVVDAIADGFAKKDVVAIADAMTPCVSAGAVPGDPALLSRTAYLKNVAADFAAGTSVQVQRRPIENDPNFGRFVRSTWSKPGGADQRVDLLLRADGDRWSVAAVLIRALGN